MTKLKIKKKAVILSIVQFSSVQFSSVLQINQSIVYLGRLANKEEEEEIRSMKSLFIFDVIRFDSFVFFSETPMSAS